MIWKRNTAWLSKTRAIAIPKIQANGNYQYTTELETIPVPGISPINNNWTANIQLVQTIYQGGQVEFIAALGEVAKNPGHAGLQDCDCGQPAGGEGRLL